MVVFVNDGQFKDYSGFPLQIPHGFGAENFKGKVPRSTDNTAMRTQMIYTGADWKEILYGTPYSEPHVGRVMYLETNGFCKRRSFFRGHDENTGVLVPFTPFGESCFTGNTVTIPDDGGPAFSGTHPTPSASTDWSFAMNGGASTTAADIYASNDFYMAGGGFSITYDYTILDVYLGTWTASRGRSDSYFLTDTIHTYNPPSPGMKWHMAAQIQQNMTADAGTNNGGSCSVSGTYGLYLFEYSLLDDFNPISITDLATLGSFSFANVSNSTGHGIPLMTYTQDFLTLPVRWALGIAVKSATASVTFGTLPSPGGSHTASHATSWALRGSDFGDDYKFEGNVIITEVPI